MRMFRAMEASASALTAERLRMDVIANNLANINTTRTPEGGPYRRRFITTAERPQAFSDVLAQKQGEAAPVTGSGVVVTSIQDDQSDFKVKFDPSNPDADEKGFVKLPNVDMLTEITDMMMSTRVYEANVTAFNAAKAMAIKALEIGK